MAPVIVDESGSSPRSTVLLEGSRITTNSAAVMDSVHDVNGKEKKEDGKETKEGSENRPDPASPVDTKATATEETKNENTPEASGGHKEGAGEADPSMTPALAASAAAAYPSHLTPQPASGYYLGYPHSQVTPEPPSPAGPGVATVSYDATSFFQQPTAGAFAPHTSAFGATATPLSPPRATTMGAIPPASPLFPRVTSAGLGGRDSKRQGGAPPSPNLPYMSPQLGTAMYHQYPMTSQGSMDSPDDMNGWSAAER